MTGNTPGKIIIRAGRTGPTYARVPDWLMFAGYSVVAQHVYRVLKAHCNTERGDGLVWPTQTVLAMLSNFSRGDKIKPYIDELAADLPGCPEGSGGAISVEYTTSMPRRTIYTVHDLPPDGWDGPRTLAEWYRANGPETRCTPVRGRRRREAEAVAKDTENQQVSAVTPPEGQQPPPGETHETPGQHSYPPEGVTSDPLEGVTSYPIQGVETIRTEPDEPTNPPNPPADDATSPAAGQTEGGGDVDDQTTAAAHQVLVEVLASVPLAKTPHRDQAAVLAREVAVALAAGWPPAELAARLGHGIATADHVAGALRYRLQQLPELPPQRPNTTTTTLVPDWKRDSAERPDRATSSSSPAAAAARAAAAAAIARRRTP
jgi:hypothetical protein